MGMDSGEQTVPNFLKNYRGEVIGGSLGQHKTEVRGLIVYACIVQYTKLTPAHYEVRMYL